MPETSQAPMTRILRAIRRVNRYDMNSRPAAIMFSLAAVLALVILLRVFDDSVLAGIILSGYWCKVFLAKNWRG